MNKFVGGLETMFEVFMFVNPIGTCCYQTEQTIMKTMKEADAITRYHLIPLANMKTIQSDLIRKHKCPTNLETYNHASEETFAALKDYHAIKMAYGNKLARKYCLAVQHNINDLNREYNTDLLKNLIQELGLSIPKIQSARMSAYLDESIAADERLAQKWHINDTPTTVIFNDEDENSGLIVEGHLLHDELLQIINGNESPDFNELSASLIRLHSSNL